MSNRLGVLPAEEVLHMTFDFWLGVAWEIHFDQLSCDLLYIIKMREMTPVRRSSKCGLWITNKFISQTYMEDCM